MHYGLCSKGLVSGGHVTESRTVTGPSSRTDSRHFWIPCVLCRWQTSSAQTQRTVWIASCNAFCAAAASGDRSGIPAASVTFNASYLLTSAVAVAVVIFRRHFLRDFAIGLDRSRLRNATETAKYGKCLDACNASATTTSVFDIPGNTLPI